MSKRKLIILSITMFLLLSFFSIKIIAPIIDHTEGDYNIVMLNKLLKEFNCNNEWLDKLDRMSNKVKNDSNYEYLIKYYRPYNQLIDDYEHLSTLIKDFTNKYRDNDLDSSILMDDIKNILLQLNDNQYIKIKF